MRLLVAALSVSGVGRWHCMMVVWSALRRLHVKRWYWMYGVKVDEYSTLVNLATLPAGFPSKW